MKKGAKFNPLRFLRAKAERRELSLDLDDVLASALLRGDRITEATARGVPALYAGVSFIAGMVSMLPVRLYSEADGKTKPLADPRTALINDDTGDLLDGVQLKAALVTDYLLNGRAYAYVKWRRNKVESIHYVKQSEVGYQKNADPIFKTATYYIGGRQIEGEYLVRLLKDTRDGVTGSGIVDSCNACLTIAADLLKYEGVLAKTGGTKKGFLKSQKRLDKDALDAVKKAWAKLWGSPNCDAMVLNDGMDFMEASGTSVEQQLDERKRNNYAEISKLLNLPASVLDGTATEAVFRQVVKTAVTPIVAALETALNRALLLESEKGEKYFSFDMNELLRGDMKTRFEAYRTAIQGGFMTRDEVRYREDLPELGFNLICLNLGDVYYNPETDEIYTPNTGETMKIKRGDEQN